MMRTKLPPAAATFAFLVVAPGGVAGLMPFLLSDWRMAPPLLGIASLRWAGTVLIVVGIPIVLASFARFVREGSGTPAPIYPTDRLIVTGLYRHMRNPMYVGVLAVIFGQALWFGSAPVLAYGGLVWLAFHVFVLLYEEPVLRRRYGAQFATYCAGVRRWLPRLTPWHDAGEKEIVR